MTGGALAGRLAVVTGASTGIGAAGARLLAALGAEVVVVGRDPARTAAVAAEVGTDPVVGDFARLADVRRVAAELAAQHRHVDVLWNNAGGYWPGRTLTTDGHELTMQVDHLAPWLLTHLLRPQLTAGGAARVIFTSSIAHRLARLRPGDLDRQRGVAAYSSAKLANLLTAWELPRRWAGSRVRAASFHPGAVASHFGRDSLAARLLYQGPGRTAFRSVEVGADTGVWLATAPAADWVDGGYHVDRRPRRPSPAGRDDRLARSLWDHTAEVLGVSG